MALLELFIQQLENVMKMFSDFDRVPVFAPFTVD